MKHLILILIAALLFAAPAEARRKHYKAPVGSTMSGVTSYYWQGSRTANGERFYPEGMTAAHRSLPFGTRLRVTYKGRSVIVRVNDRGPFIKGRFLDLSKGAARQLGILKQGLARVTAEVI